MLGQLLDDDLQRWSHVALEQMPGDGTAIALSEHDMRMKDHLSIRSQRNCAEERSNLDLLANRVPANLLCVPRVVAEHHIAKRTDAGEMAAPQLVRRGERE